MVLLIYVIFKDYLLLGFLGSIATRTESYYNPVLLLIPPDSFLSR